MEFVWGLLLLAMRMESLLFIGKAMQSSQRHASILYDLHALVFGPVCFAQATRHPTKPKALSLRFCLHSALVFFGSGEMVSSLIEAAADINEQLRVPSSRILWWSILKMLHAKHYLSSSALTYLAYHHYGATPLIVSIRSPEWVDFKL